MSYYQCPFCFLQIGEMLMAQKAAAKEVALKSTDRPSYDLDKVKPACSRHTGMQKLPSKFPTLRPTNDPPPPPPSFDWLCLLNQFCPNIYWSVLYYPCTSSLFFCFFVFLCYKRPRTSEVWVLYQLWRVMTHFSPMRCDSWLFDYLETCGKP